MINRIVSAALRYDQLIPKLYATAAILSIPSIYKAHLHALRNLIRDDLRTGFFRGQAPSKKFAEHAKDIMGLTLHRASRTRARTELEGPARRNDDNDLANTLPRLLNGDWRSDQIQHFCHEEGCCNGGSREVCCDKLCAVLTKAVLQPIAAKRPSTSRWHTMSPSLCSQTLGILLHRVLPRVRERAQVGSAGHEVDAEHDVDAQNWHEQNHRHNKLSLEFLTDTPSTDVKLAAALVTTEPTDNLFARLQHLDHTRNGVAEALGTGGCVSKCQRQLFGLLHLGSKPSALQTLLHHFKHRQCTDDVMAELHRISLTFAAQVWARLETLLANWPWRLLKADQTTLGDFFHEDKCCLDESFSEPLRDIASAADMEDLTTGHFDCLRSVLARHLTLTNMPLENLLAEHRTAVPIQKGKPHMETTAYLGLLGQVHKQFEERGGRLSFQQPREELVRRAAPVPTTAARYQPKRRGARLDVRWVNGQISQRSAATTGLDLVAPATRRRELHAQWRTMSKAERSEAWRQLCHQGRGSGLAEASRAAPSRRPAPQRPVRGKGHASGSAEALVPPNMAAGQPGPSISRVLEKVHDESVHGLDDWTYHSSRWPVHPDLLDALLRERTQRSSGYARLGETLRWSARPMLLHEENHTAVPTDRVFKRRLSCSQRHPGLCYARDAALYPQVLAMASSLERVFLNEHVGRYFCICADGAGRVERMLVYFAHRRARRPFAQQTHLFIRFDNHACVADDDSLTIKVSSECLRLHGQYMFASVWDIAKSFLAKSCTRLSVQQYVHALHFSREALGIDVHLNPVMAGGEIPVLWTDDVGGLQRKVTKTRTWDPRLAACEEKRQTTTAQKVGGIMSYVGDDKLPAPDPGSAGSSRGPKGDEKGPAPDPGSAGSSRGPRGDEKGPAADPGSAGSSGGPKELAHDLGAATSSCGQAAPPLLVECVAEDFLATSNDEEEPHAAREAWEVQQQDHVQAARAATREAKRKRKEEKEKSKNKDRQDTTQKKKRRKRGHAALPDDVEAVAVAVLSAQPRPAPHRALPPRAEQHRYHRVPVPSSSEPGADIVGYILFNINANSLDAHCCRHEGNPKLHCSVNRTVSGAASTGVGHAAQGRPLGFLVAWLRCACQFEAGPTGRDPHFQARLGSTGGSGFLASGASAERQAAREWVRNSPDMQALAAKERPLRDGEPEEPLGLP